jgi:hypothetical protein
MKNYPTLIKVDKSDYEVFEFSSGYYGICEKNGAGRGCVSGGDSANEDDYNRGYIENIFNEWDGTLHYSNMYGYQIAE